MGEVRDSWLHTLAAKTSSLFLAYIISISIYRLYFSPKAKFPGPKLAAVTGWYEFYYDIINGGQFIWKIQELHDKYGPIVRINPYELHVRDSDFYDELYAPASKKRDKYASWIVLSGGKGSSFATVEHEHHRLRRSALNQFFSKRSVGRLEPVIVDKIERLCLRLEDAVKTNEIIRFDAAYVALTTDIIGESYDYLSQPDFNLEWKHTVVNAMASGALLRHFPWMIYVLKTVPSYILEKMDPKGAALMKWQLGVRKKIISIIEDCEQGK